MELIEPISNILGMLLALGLYAVLRRVADKFGLQASEDELRKIIFDFVKAAEQTLKADDPTGELRRKFVLDQLTALGYEITDTIKAAIESAVWEVNQRELQSSAK